MAKPKKKRKSKYDITVKAPEGMTFDELLTLAATTKLPKKTKGENPPEITG